MVFISCLRLAKRFGTGLQMTVASADKLARMVRENQELRLKRQRKNVMNKPKAKHFFENEKMQQYNKMILQNLNLLKSQSGIQDLMFASGLVFSKVKVSVNWNEVYVLWKANGAALNIGQLSH